MNFKKYAFFALFLATGSQAALPLETLANNLETILSHPTMTHGQKFRESTKRMNTIKSTVSENETLIKSYLSNREWTALQADLSKMEKSIQLLQFSKTLKILKTLKSKGSSYVGY